MQQFEPGTTLQVVSGKKKIKILTKKRKRVRSS